MSNADLIKFRDLLTSGAEFQDKFRKAVENYKGPQDEKAVFDNLLLPLAQERGLSATYEEFKVYTDSFKETDGELSERELAQVAGGKDSGYGFCIGVGAGDMFGDKEKGVGARITCQAVGLAVCPGVG